MTDIGRQVFGRKIDHAGAEIAQEQEKYRTLKPDQLGGLAGRKDIYAHGFIPNMIRASSKICSPANTIHVTPATGHAT